MHAQPAHTERANPDNSSGSVELVRAHLSLARSIARKYRGRGESDDDLDQVAFVGLVNAARRFDPNRGVAFSTFAVATVTGELKRHFRNTRWKVHVSRSLQERYLLVRDTLDEARMRLRRSPTIAEIATLTGLSEEEVIEAYEVGSTFQAESLDREAACSGFAGSALRTDDISGRVIDRLSAAAAVSSLPDRERRILELRFTHQLSQSEIATRLGISQMQVSRLLKRVLTELRNQLAPPSASR